MMAYRGVRAATLSLAVLALEVPAAAQVVVNEIDADTPGTDSAEFIEIANTSAAPVNLDGFDLVLVNGGLAVPIAYLTIDLPDVELAAGDYYVVCADPDNTPGCDLDVSPDSNLVQNGSPDAVALFEGLTPIDVVSYGGSTLGFTEGTGTVNDTDTAFLGLSRSPDGADTGDNSADVSRRCITPGSSNATATTSCPDPSIVCGDGATEGDEQCDDGPDNGTTECGCTLGCEYVAGSTPCGNTSSSECDLGDICDGVGACFANPVAAGEPCGDSNQTECNLPDTCNGSGVCELNQSDTGQPCGDPSVSECDLADTCGADGECAVNWFADDEPCGDQSDSDCTNPDRCDSGICSPNDDVPGQSCGNQVPGVCDEPDVCDGAGTCDPNPTPAGGACGSGVDDDCTDADSCDQFGQCMSNDEGFMVPCGDPTDDACRDPDTCDGFGSCLPNDQPDGTPCGNGAFCDGDEVCADAACDGGEPPCAEGEVCDEDGDQCARPDCGDGEVVEGEECDDGNQQDDDGCSQCAIDPGWVCGDDQPVDGTSDCTPSCGDGEVGPYESCDDDGIDTGDGCDDHCQIEPGWDCVEDGGDIVCTPMCGDGLVLAGEECDDGNLAREDGCGQCQVERGWLCDDAEPTECEQLPDDGGCSGCRTGGGGGSGLPLLLLLALIRRRRAARLRPRARRAPGR